MIVTWKDNFKNQKIKPINFLSAMPADDSLELFDVVCPTTGEPLLVSESGEGSEARGGGGGGDSADDDDAERKTSTTTSTSTSTSKRRRLTVPRGVAHATGAWHASVYVHLSRSSDGAFLLQRRSARKDVCPLLWDLACAEHVASGETRLEAALRGLGEELGLTGAVGISSERLGPPLGPPRQAVLRVEGPPLVWDREVVTSYWLRDFCEEKSEGAKIKFDEDEVSEIRWILPSELKREAEEHPERFTPWFLAELRARPELLLL